MNKKFILILPISICFLFAAQIDNSYCLCHCKKKNIHPFYFLTNNRFDYDQCIHFSSHRYKSNDD
ncbi:hypothetical protein DERF_013187 [Dermatophagoides farinae]|uniref:Uncharacterized protein n=1 Tax=Dermatophagoides farinae TaxID=6954 RepID=A0A922HLJ8_DERFA|nr:hypothetical protein DERF_013187 [Dermatophagoides farinae]